MATIKLQLQNNAVESLGQQTRRDHLLHYLKQFGTSSLSFSSLQDGLKCYLLPGDGYLAYAPSTRVPKMPICLSDPICSVQTKQMLLKEFVESYTHPVFIHVSKDTADILHNLDFFVNEMGVETIIDIQDFTISGGKKEFLRSQRNRAIKDGVHVVESLSGQISTEDMRKISESWMNEKTVSSNELSFLARPAVFEDEPGVRKFFAIKDGKPIGYVFFDPMHKDGEVCGYLANVLRSYQSVSYSVCDYIIIEAINKFRQEGVAQLSLGLSPMADIDDTGEFRFSKPLQLAFRLIFKRANHLYPFQSLAFHKQRYRPGSMGCRQEKVYCATRTQLPIRSLFHCFNTIGIHPVSQTARSVQNLLKKLQMSAMQEFQTILGLSQSTDSLGLVRVRVASTCGED